MANARPASDGPMTFTRRARKAQIIEMTIELVAEKGYAGTTLSGIAERSGITKAAVLYHFPGKSAVVSAAYELVLHELVTNVGAAVDAAAASDGPSGYARSMIEHLSARPQHSRMIIEALIHQEGESESSARWGPLAKIVQVARRARGLEPDPDSRTTAIVIGGAIDAIVAEKLHDPAYDADSAAGRLVDLIEASYAMP